MKRHILFLMTILLGIMAYGQDTQYEDVVYLKNGSIIHGMIIEQIPNETITIKTADRNLFVFEFDQIEKITKEEVLTGKEGQAESLPDKGYVPVDSKGFESTLDVFLAMELEWSDPVLGMQFHVGYRFFPQLYVGAGGGIELYSDGNMMPLFLQIRTDFIEAHATPFFAINTGYAFGWVNDMDGSDWGGVFIEPSIGVRFNISEHFGLNLSSGFKFQRAYYTDYYYDPLSSYYTGEYRTSTTYRLFSFKVGFSF